MDLIKVVEFGVNSNTFLFVPRITVLIVFNMPYSKSEAQKRRLFDSLVASQTVTVTLELNPYKYTQLIATD